ncbi:hypothetical protein [Streptomyces sp. NBC_01363]|uniref:hypothetical protein n=1 Tax=Streptomyces sp. NBC_01363 TaxID=2903840 RepID=UPI0022534D1C|nr:hypothetical protein [Streptomyces sp. NBC_01363]MCX4736345.1 hypothetical protein [Streptomyces sp. NBC_01363]
MIGAASFSPAYRRMWDGGVLLLLLWLVFHLLSCAHSHGTAFDTHHGPTNAVAAAAAPAATPPGPAAASSPDPAPCCPETDHTADWIRIDAPPPPAPGGALPVEVRPWAPAAALPGNGTARAPDHGLLGGRCILTALCVART